MEFIGRIFTSIIGGIFADATERELAAHANRRRPGEPFPTSAHFGWISKLAGVVVCIFFVPLVSLMALVVVTGNHENAWLAFPFLCAVAIWLSLMSYDMFVRRIEWNETEVRFRKWNSDRTLPWDDIVAVQEKTAPTYLRIAFRDGSGFAISETMHGSRHFLAIIVNRLDPEDRDGGKRRRRRQRGKKS